jgi:hypothetical protein
MLLFVHLTSIGLGLRRLFVQRKRSVVLLTSSIGLVESCLIHGRWSDLAFAVIRHVRQPYANEKAYF